MRRFHAVNEAFIRTLLARTGKSVVVDSSKVGIRLKYLLQNPALDVRVIRLVRDGRAVALTYTDPAVYADAANPDLRGGGDGASRDRERLTLRQAAHEWRRSNEEADAILARLEPAHATTVTYEELCTDSDGVLRRLYAFVGVEPANAGRAWRGQEHHVLGNGMRFDTGADVRLDDR